MYSILHCVGPLSLYFFRYKLLTSIVTRMDVETIGCLCIMRTTSVEFRIT